MHHNCNRIPVPGRARFWYVGRCAASKSRRAGSLRSYVKVMRQRPGRWRVAASAADAVTMVARDVLSQRGGHIGASMAPQRRRHCKIAPGYLLAGSLVASDGRRNGSVCCRCGGRSIGGGRCSSHCCFGFVLAKYYFGTCAFRVNPK